MIEATRNFLKAETDEDQLYWLSVMDKRIMKVMKPALIISVFLFIAHVVVWLV